MSRKTFIFAAIVAVCLALARPAVARAQEGIRVTTDKTVDTRSLESIVRDVVRLSGAKTDDEKAIAIHNWLHHTIFHCAYPTEKRPQSVGPLKVINVYGWGLCGGQHTVLKALFETAGWKVRYRGWRGHTTIETYYVDRWHYFDVFLKCYYWTKDRKTIAGQDDIIKDPSIVLDGPKDGRVPPNHYLVCGDSAKGVVSGCQGSKPHQTARPEQGWASVTGRDRGYKPLLSLPPGASLRLEWRAHPGQTAGDVRNRHTCGTKDFRSDKVLGPILQHYGPRTYANGRFVYAPDLASAAGIELSGARVRGGKVAATSGKGAAVFDLALPYAYTSGRIEAEFEGGEGKLSVSGDGGKTWRPAPAGDVSPLLRQNYDVRIKAEFAGALAKFRFEATVQHNRSSQPHLVNGPNAVTVSSVDNKMTSGRVLTVAYAYQEARVPDPARVKRWDGREVKYGETRTVKREMSDLPHTWSVEVGGNVPPKMLHLEYAVSGR